MADASPDALSTGAPPGRPGIAQPLLAGFVAALIGFAGTFALVLAGLRAVGASESQASSGLMVLTVSMGLLSIALSLHHRMPITSAWSTPGAALLIAGGAVSGGYPAAIGAFLLAGVLIVIAGLWGPLERLIESIPAPIASAMLAGVLLPVCLTPVHALVGHPWLAGPPILVWALLTRFARRWAAPGALLATAIAIVIDDAPTIGSSALPHLAFTAPAFDVGTLVGLGLPLFIVTMASQNITGMSVLATFGYRPRLGPLLVSTGATSIVGAPFGGHAVNLAAISAALTAGPDADPDPSRRWIAAVGWGLTCLVQGLGAGLATALVATAPPVVIESVAGLALLASLAAATRTALADETWREPAMITFVVSASAVTIWGIGAPFWGLLAGLGFGALHHRRRAPVELGDR